MGVLSVLVILKYAYLDQEGTEHRSCAPVSPIAHLAVNVIIIMLDRADIAEVNFVPAIGMLETHLSKFLNIVNTVTSQELDLRRCVRFVAVEVKQDFHKHDRDQLEEVYAEQVRLRAVGLPEVRRIW
jgi:hypothetical protein